MAEKLTQPEQPYGLTTQQVKAIDALLTERDTRAAAKASGTAERTLRRWMNDPAFALALRDAEASALDQTTRRLLGLHTSATDVLQSLMEDTAIAPAIRLRAATSALELLLKIRELRNVEGRLLALEAAMQQPGQTL